MSHKSARLLGYEIGGMSSTEVNALLEEEGFLSGEPGNYEVTEKGREYVNEKDYHRGTGGYSQYNRYWTTRSWDPRILDEIGEVSPERKRELSEKVTRHREEALRRNYGIDEIVASNEDDVEMYKNDTDGYDNENVSFNSNVFARNSIIFLAIAGCVFIIYKGVVYIKPHAKKWWKQDALPRINEVKRKFRPDETKDQ
jgi:hypothetical protein